MEVKNRYQEAATHALAGFQLVEERLKEYIGYHYDAVRALLAGRIAFLHKREEIENASLERLTTAFAHITLNAELVKEIRALTRIRNEVAHRALIHLYGPRTDEEEMAQNIQQFIEVADKLSKIMKQILIETTQVHQVKKQFEATSSNTE